MLTKFGKYELRREVGKGAMGVVYLAQDARLGRPAALKVMSPGVASDPELLRRFYQEATSAGKLSHPGIVVVYDIDEEAGVPYIAMEFLEGQTLQQMIQEGCRVSIVRKLDIIKQAAGALHFAHQKGVIHRDVKPSNIMVLSDGHVKIVDFGIARVDGTPLTRSGSVLGTPYYMSPEQVRGEKVDARSDIFSLGTILYEMFALKNPFAGRDVPSSLNRICRHTPQPLPQLVPDCPPELQRIVQKATAKNREERYQSAEDMFLDTSELAGTLKRTIVDQHVQQGQRLLREGNLPLAEDVLRKALTVDSSHNLARSLLREVQEQVRERQRQERVRELLGRAEQAALAQRDQEYFDLAGEALKLDSDNQNARQHRAEAAGRVEKARLAAERLAALRAHVGEAIEKKDFEAALRDAVQALLEFPGDDELQELRQRAEAQVEARRQELRADECVRAVREMMSAGRWSDALACVEEALGDAPGNDRLLAVRKSALEGQARARLEAVRSEAIARCRALVEQRKYAAAQEQLERTIASVGTSTELTRLLALAVEQEGRERRSKEMVAEATSCLREEKYAEAIRLLEEARNECPSPDIDALLRSAHEQLAERKCETIRLARELLREGEASQALETLKAAPANLADDEEFERLFAQASAEVERATMAFRSETEAGIPSAESEAELQGPRTALSDVEIVPPSRLSGPSLDQALDIPMRDPAVASEVQGPASADGSRPRPILLLLVAAGVIIVTAALLTWRLAFHRNVSPRIAAPPPVTASTPVPVSVSSSVASPVAATSNLPEVSPRNRPAKRPAPHRAAHDAESAGKAAIPPKVSQLTVTSDLTGAKIVLDGQSDAAWTTPHTFDRLKPGLHHVELLMQGYPSTYADVTVEAGEPRIFNLPVERPTGAVHIITEPPGLEVLIDGKSCGPSPVQKNLPVGHHTWAVVLGTGQYSSGFDLTEGSLLEARYPARGRVSAPGTGSIVVRSNPPGATVFVDGAPVAKTNVTLKLARGSHNLLLSLPGCQPYSQAVAITAGTNAPAIDKQLRCN